MTAPTPNFDELDRLFACLVKNARAQRPEQLARGLTVSELLAFVPYKDVRTDIGANTNDDYGHAVTRLLAGDKGYVFGDDLMQDDLKAELKAKVPDLQAYRSYLNTKVTLAQERVRAVLDGLGPAPERSAESSAPAAQRPAAATSMSISGERLKISRERPVPNPTAPRAPGLDAKPVRPGCKYCGQQLPPGRDVRFCPHCGQDLSVLRCSACSAELEPGWKFCVACGRAAAD